MSAWAYGLAADAVVAVHFLFVLFVGAGGLLLIRWPRLAWLHLPCAIWGAAISFGGWICPLTPLEVRFRVLAGQGGYAGGFIEHYLVPILYPAALTREMQFGIGAGVLVINAVAYAIVFARRKSRADRRSR
jgi:hypothetical protein